jgi:precorrin-2 dehydrogenase/sirohydrochlorin ferrochelatase
MLDGSKISALVVGGGRVALRKAQALLDAGAQVTVVAMAISEELEELSVVNSRLSLVVAEYNAAYIGDASIIVAATGDASVNLRVADDASHAHRLVNVVNAPSSGTFITPAVHRNGDLTVAVSAGRVPAIAAAIRDAIAQRFDDRYAAAISDLREMRDRLLAGGDQNAWAEISAEICDESFCALVESDRLKRRTAQWR